MYNRIELIQGDTYETALEINGLTDFTIIDKVTFSSADLGFCKTLTFNTKEKNYSLILLPEETDRCKEGRYDYDITIKFKDKNVLTIIYKGEIVVLLKKNRC